MEGGGGSGQHGGCPNENSGADARAFVSALLGEGNIMDKEGGSPKENLLVAVAAPAETITAVVVADDGPKEKLASGMNVWAASLLSASTSALHQLSPRHFPLPYQFGTRMS